MQANDPDLEAYRQAVAAMRALPAADPRHWTRQAEIHRNFCPHGNWYFLPWHRAYLTAFERICRQLSGKVDFALPYWDWTLDRRMPAAFTAGNPGSNILNHARDATPADSLPAENVGPQVVERILRSPDFEAFGSSRANGQSSADSQWLRRRGRVAELEGNPHNSVHGFIGGDMGTYMSPLDPLFWLHHANADRLWYVWNSRQNPNSSEAMWRNMRFGGQFVEGAGAAWAPAVSDLLTTDPLGYRYGGTIAPAPAPAPLRNNLQALRRIDFNGLATVGSELRRVPLRTGNLALANATRLADDDVASTVRPLSVPVPMGNDLANLVRPVSLPPSGTIAAPAVRLQRVMASLLDISPPADPKTKIRVFINCDYLSPTTPISDDHYVTTLAFFGTNEGHAHGESSGQLSFAVDLTETLSKLSRGSGLSGSDIVVQLVPVNDRGGTPEATQLKPDKIVIVVI